MWRVRAGSVPARKRRTPPRRPPPGHPSRPARPPPRPQRRSCRPPAQLTLAAVLLAIVRAHPAAFMLVAAFPRRRSASLPRGAERPRLWRSAALGQRWGKCPQKCSRRHVQSSLAASSASSGVADTLPSPPKKKKKKRQNNQTKPPQQQRKTLKEKESKMRYIGAPTPPRFPAGVSGQEGGSSYNPQAERAGRPPGSSSAAPRLPLGSSDASAPLRLPPRSRAAAAASLGRPPPATCCPGRGKGSLGRRLLLAAGASSRRPAPPGREGGDGDGGRMEPGAGPGP